MVNVYLSVLNRIILHRAFRHFQCFLKFFRRTKSEKGYLTTTLYDVSIFKKIICRTDLQIDVGLLARKHF